MKNVSINNESLELNVYSQYYIIDVLYLTDIKNEFLKASSLPEDIRKEVFLYTDTPFALYKPDESTFYINQIIKVDYDEVILEDFSFFSTDTGLIVFISEDILIEFLKDFNYEDLVDSENELINEIYWKQIISKFKLVDVGLVLAGSDSENDFDGSGTYKVTPLSEVF
ncbi:MULTISPECIES: hypothetical protein [unclassified Flavobacterium]|uniref:hypothetical protein n=1 Tax=unclassified Flavobacterium TaxID=196869 RepID=UPI00057E8093|nr:MULTISPECIES: hypothetical protein [unclassified Flavobacterium]KIA99616.1 hypothetical protein OA93_05590 [Flavobacterium sp. KMS]MEA9414173.1 hypothetical protein [Flavobacterium sp. PL02]